MANMSFAFKHSLKVRFRDVDMLGHVNNAVYFTYLEESRVAFFGSLGYQADHFKTRCPIILAEASCQYKSPSYVDEMLDIYIRVSEIRNASFIMEYEIKEQRSDRLVAAAKTALVTFDYENQKVIPIPETLRKKLEEAKKGVS